MIYIKHYVLILPLLIAIREIWLLGLTYGMYLVLFLKPGAIASISECRSRSKKTQDGTTNKMSSINKLDTMIMVVFTLQAMFYMVFACVAEERIALMHIRSLFLESNSSILPPSWFQSEDCCSWDRIKCSHNSAQVSHMNLSILRQPSAEDWTLDLTIFSPFHDLKVLDLSYNYANLHNPDGMQLLSHSCIIQRYFPRQYVCITHQRNLVIRSWRHD
jgi:hypothetical protein